MAGVRKRGKTFTITAYMGYDADGRQIKKTTTYRPPAGVTPAKAEKLARAFAAVWEDSVKGYTSLDENMNFRELADWYYGSIAPNVLKEKTLLEFRRTIELHVMPVLGNVKLKSITPALLDAMFAKMLKGAGGAKPLRPGSVNKVRQNLSAIFTAAEKKEIMRRNPCRLVTTPKTDTEPAAFLDAGQCRRLLAAAHAQDDFQLEVIINLLLATGLRAGEMCGLSWKDIDLDNGMLYVRHTLVRVKGEFRLTEPKTATSRRVLLLGEHMVSMLREHKAMQAQERERAARWKRPDAVFTSKTGDYLISCNLNPRLAGLCRSADIPQIHLHSLRHTHASLLINSDISARIIADRLGHMSTKTTLDTYSHVFKESEARAAGAIDMAIFGDKR